ncbi:Protein hook [Sergentomyia squamirostris]
MENEKVELCESLIKWLQCLKLSGAQENAISLSDGVVMAKALNQIAPEHFTGSWLSKIKTDVSQNWRLKHSNLKKVVEGIFDYYIDVLSLNLSDVAKPDVTRIADADRGELTRLLQLILGCAVNCAEKESYITQIMELEVSLQRNIMRALQDLEEAWQGTGPSINPDGRISIPQFDVKALQEERDVLAQKCHEMERQITFHLEEKTTMQQEIVKLNELIEKIESPVAIGDDGTSIGPVQLGSARYNDLRKQLDAVKDELLQAETARDDLKMKSRQQEIEIINLQAKVDELHQASTELSQLKDEIDVLREASDKLKIYENQLVTYKKKLEDHSDLRKQVKMLEERSAEYLRQNNQHEEDSKKYAGLKGQVELYKKEIQELHLKLDTEISKSAKIEFELRNMEGNLSALQREKENLLIERDTLRETCDELRCTQGSTSDSTNTISREIISPALKEKIDRLEAENKALREGQGGQTALAQLLDDSNQRTEKLREQLKTANQKILTLTQGQTDESSAKGNLVVQLRQALELNEQRASQVEESHLQVNNLQGKITQLEAALTAREQELTASETRYRKCVEKTKEMIKSIDPRLSSEISLLDQGKSNDPEPEPRGSSMTSREEQLIVSAFFRMGLERQREAIDARFAILSGSGQSFLARQRQPVPRNKPAASFKTK